MAEHSGMEGIIEAIEALTEQLKLTNALIATTIDPSGMCIRYEVRDMADGSGDGAPECRKAVQLIPLAVFRKVD